MAANHNEVTVSQAKEPDIESLTTILPRAFHPVNPFLKNIFPDTEVNRQWWTRTYKAAFQDPDCKTLVAHTADSGDKVIGILDMWYETPQGYEARTRKRNATLPADIPYDEYANMYGIAVEWAKKSMPDKRFCNIHLFGVDYDYQRSGVGSALLKEALEVNDEKGIETFVEANGNARPFYERFGFVCRHTQFIGDYSENMLVRPVKGGS